MTKEQDKTFADYTKEEQEIFKKNLIWIKILYSLNNFASDYIKSEEEAKLFYWITNKYLENIWQFINE